MSKKTKKAEAYPDLLKIGYRPCETRTVPGTRCEFDVMLTPSGYRNVRIIPRQQKYDFRYWVDIDSRMFGYVDEFALWTGGLEEYIYIAESSILETLCNEHRRLIRVRETLFSFNVKIEQSYEAHVEPMPDVMFTGIRMREPECDHWLGLMSASIVPESEWQFTSWEFSRRFKYCPNCGIQLF